MSECQNKKHKTFIKHPGRLITALALLSALAMLLSGCKEAGTNSNIHEGVSTERAAPANATPQTSTLADPSENSSVTTDAFSITSENQDAITRSSTDDNTFVISASGDYYVKGLLENGRIVVNVPDVAADNGTVKLILSGAAVTCSFDAPIAAVSAEKVDIEAAEGTYNIVTDARPEATEASNGNVNAAGETSDEDETLDCDGAIFAACDMKISGKGTLIVDAGYDNGIKSKDDLTVKNVTLKVTAAGNALKGNDSVSVESGNIILVSTGGDAIKTSSSDVSAKGNQRGSVTISGGQCDIYAAKDGISAAYDAVISGTAVVNIFTASYSNYSDPGSTASAMYLVVPRSNYSASNGYYAYFYNNDPDPDGSDGIAVKCTYETMVYSGRSASYYALKFKAPSGYDNVRFCVTRSEAEFTGANMSGGTSGEAVNRAVNAFLITSFDSGTKALYGDWVTLSPGSGKSSKTSFSSKGIKAYNEVIISGGTVIISCGDDGIHANGGEALENGSRGSGNVTVSGGVITIQAADDGIHADNILTIKDGSVTVSGSYEGLEANVINIEGGKTFVQSSDDGVNACRGAASPLVNVTGGYLDVTTPSGDTDGIDSNGSITVSGGFVIVKGGSSQGGMAGSVDVDGTLKVTGGTVVAIGGICETPASGSVNTFVSSGASFSAGEYVLSDASGNVLLSFSLSGSYYSCWIASDGLLLNGQYKLSRDGSLVLDWTQSSSTVGSSGQGGPGGPGGWGGGHGHGGRP